MTERDGRGGSVWRLALIALAAVALTTPAVAAQTAQPRAISLDEALTRARRQSEQVDVARAGITRARGNELQARSAYLPQINGSFSYNRTLRSQFASAGGSARDTTSTPVICQGSFAPDSTQPLDQRIDYLEGRLGCPSGGLGGGLDFSRFGFGSRNTYNLGLSLAQSLYSGGRIGAQNRIARSGSTLAEITLSTADAQVQLDAAQAYFDAQLADRLLEIGQAALAQAEATLRQAELQQRAGAGAEFDVLRARVARDNQRPAVIQARTARELAYLRLKQILNLPAAEDVRLTTPLGEDVPVAAPAGADTTSELRAPVRQAAEAVTIQEQQLRIARAQGLPNLSLVSQYGRVAYPNGLFPDWSDFRSNWTVGLAAQVPIFTGGRTRGQAVVARADLEQARAQLRQVRELAALDTRSVLAQLEAARATLEASSGTVQQAERAYGIAELRYREGISTQIELSDARLQLQQARANRAQTARNYQVARARVALLPYLPLGSAGGVTAASVQTQQGTQNGFSGAQPGAATQQQNGGVAQPQQPGGATTGTTRF